MGQGRQGRLLLLQRFHLLIVVQGKSALSPFRGLAKSVPSAPQTRPGQPARVVKMRIFDDKSKTSGMGWYTQRRDGSFECCCMFHFRAGLVQRKHVSLAGRQRLVGADHGQESCRVHVQRHQQGDDRCPACSSACYVESCHRVNQSIIFFRVLGAEYVPCTAIPQGQSGQAERMNRTRVSF